MCDFIIFHRASRDETWSGLSVLMSRQGVASNLFYSRPLTRMSGLVAGVTSLAGKVGLAGRSAYSPSKFTQAGFFEALRTELAGTAST